MSNYIKREDDRYSYLYNKKKWPDGPVRDVCDKMEDHISTENKSILDCGCGHSTLRKYIKFKTYTGIDVASYQINKNISNNKDSNVTFIHGSLTETLPFKDNEFDYVFCLDVLEHIPEKYIDVVLKEMFRVGKVFIYSICLTESKGLDKNGNNLHLTVKDELWWKHKIKNCGYIVKHGEQIKNGRTILLKLIKPDNSKRWSECIGP